MTRALIVPVDGHAEIRDISADLSTLQKLVNGFIESVPPFPGAEWHAIVNEEGKFYGLPWNPGATGLLRSLGWPRGDFISGPAVILGVDPIGNDVDVPRLVLRMAAELHMIQEMGKG